MIWVLGRRVHHEQLRWLGLEFWKTWARCCAPRTHGAESSAHPTPPLWSGGAEAPQWSTGEVLHDEGWLDTTRASRVTAVPQRNDPRIVRADYARRPAKPIVVTETLVRVHFVCNHGRGHRFGAWSAVLSGAAGHVTAAVTSVGRTCR